MGFTWFSNGQFNNPHGIAVVRSSGDVYILDTGNNRVQKFDSNGNFVLKWGPLVQVMANSTMRTVLL